MLKGRHHLHLNYLSEVKLQVFPRWKAVLILVLENTDAFGGCVLKCTSAQT